MPQSHLPTFKTVLTTPHFNLSAHTFTVHSLPLHRISATYTWSSHLWSGCYSRPSYLGPNKSNHCQSGTTDWQTSSTHCATILNSSTTQIGTMNSPTHPQHRTAGLQALSNPTQTTNSFSLISSTNHNPCLFFFPSDLILTNAILPTSPDFSPCCLNFFHCLTTFSPVDYLFQLGIPLKLFWGKHRRLSSTSLNDSGRTTTRNGRFSHSGWGTWRRGWHFSMILSLVH